MFSLIKNQLRLFSILVLLCLFFLFLSFIPNIYELSQKKIVPQDRIMIAGEHIYTYDYNVYLSKIRQGIDGRASVVDKYDNNPQAKGVYLQMMYLGAGAIGGLFTNSPAVIFHTLRVVLSIVWMATIVFLCLFFINPYIQNTKYKIPFVLAVFFCLFSASMPFIYEMEGTTWIGMYMQWWQEMDIVKRLSYVPHYTAGYILLSCMTVLMVVYTTTRQLKYFFALTFLLFLSFFIHPSGGLTFLISWGLYNAILLIRKRELTFKKVVNVGQKTLILMGVALIPLLYIQSVTSSLPWASLVLFDKTNPLPLSIKEYIMALGPLFYTGVLGGIIAIKNKQYELIALATWVFGAFLGIGIFSIITIQSPARFVQTANHIPLAVLSAYFIQQIITTKKKYIFTLLTSLFVVFVILLGIIQIFFSIKAQNLFNFQKARASQPLVAYPSQVTHPLRDIYNAYRWLDTHTKNDDVILSKITAGNFIPAYSGNFVYLGHNPETPNFYEREIKVKEFYSFKQSPEELQTFLKKEKISYIFYGPQEKEESDKKPILPFLKPVYDSNFATIYKVSVIK